MVDRSHVGVETGTVRLPVEAGKIREFARAVKDDNPVFRDREAARAAGFDDVPAPPTFSTVSAHFTTGPGAMRALGLDLPRMLHGENRWTYHRVPVAGDVLHGTTRVRDVYTKPGRKGGEMTFVVLATEYVDESGAPVLTEEMTLIQTADVVEA